MPLIEVDDLGEFNRRKTMSVLYKIKAGAIIAALFCFFVMFFVGIYGTSHVKNIVIIPMFALLAFFAFIMLAIDVWETAPLAVIMFLVVLVMVILMGIKQDGIAIFGEVFVEIGTALYQIIELIM